MLTDRDYQKKLIALIPHYRSLFIHADYVYLASDAAICEAGVFLREASMNAFVMRNLPVVMVKPGFKCLCRAFKCDSHENLSKTVPSIPGTKGVPVIDDFGRKRLFEIFERLEKNPSRVGSYSSNLHIMQSADSEWNDRGKLSLNPDELWTDVPEQRAIQMAVYHKYRQCSQIVISQDVKFLRTLRELCKVGIKGSPNPNGLITLSINEQGYLFDPFESAEAEDLLLNRISRNKLSALVQKQATFIDDSALRHPKASEMLQNIKPGLIEAGKALIVLADKNQPLEFSDVLIARAQENPPTVRFSWLNGELGKTEALTAALFSETASMPTNSKITLITDRVSRAEKIQQSLAGSGIFVEIYSVNKHGFLSNRDKMQDLFSFSKSMALTEVKNKQLMEQAIKSENVQAALSLASDRDVLKNGVITCLCEKKADVLELLLKQADRISYSIIDWWILEYKQFQSPSFLLENPRFYDLLVLALSKCMGFDASSAEKCLDKLQDLEESPTAAKVELSFLISLFKLSIEHAGVTGITRIRRADIPKELPRSERSETDLLRLKLQELFQQKKRVMKEIDKLLAEQADLERQIIQLEVQLS
ncbi:MAG: hypothetical protein Q4C05_01740 [Akkermansia sp.]|nr:hypothetical protein [Akkermansia sp.]